MAGKCMDDLENWQGDSKFLEWWEGDLELPCLPPRTSANSKEIKNDVSQEWESKHSQHKAKLEKQSQSLLLSLMSRFIYNLHW